MRSAPGQRGQDSIRGIRQMPSQGQLHHGSDGGQPQRQAQHPARGQGQTQAQAQQYQGNGAEPEEDLMLEGVILPALSSVSFRPKVRARADLTQLMDRIPNDQARYALTRLRQAFEEAENAIPGVTSALVLEIVENVEQVDEA